VACVAAAGVFFDTLGILMLKLKHILLASHGTEGARAAEKLAYAICQPATRLHHLIVVPDLWKGAMGDDWLNNASTREVFGRYVESLLEDEIRIHIKRMLRETRKRKIRYDYEIVQGKPTECLLHRVARGPVDLIVLGAPRAHDKTGLRSRMLDEKLFKSLKTPVLVASQPRG
jgi:nucleotide-binding universal stress UspA family protein